MTSFVSVNDVYRAIHSHERLAIRIIPAGRADKFFVSRGGEAE